MPLATDISFLIEEALADQEKLRNIQSDKNSQLLFASSTKGGTEDKI